MIDSIYTAFEDEVLEDDVENITQGIYEPFERFCCIHGQVIENEFHQEIEYIDNLREFRFIHLCNCINSIDSPPYQPLVINAVEQLLNVFDPAVNNSLLEENAIFREYLSSIIPALRTPENQRALWLLNLEEQAELLIRTEMRFQSSLAERLGTTSDLQYTDIWSARGEIINELHFLLFSFTFHHLSNSDKRKKVIPVIRSVISAIRKAIRQRVQGELTQSEMREIGLTRS